MKGLLTESELMLVADFANKAAAMTGDKQSAKLAKRGLLTESMEKILIGGLEKRIEYGTLCEIPFEMEQTLLEKLKKL